MLDIVLPIILCAVFFRVDAVWVCVYCMMIVLKTLGMTAVVTDIGLFVLYVVTFLFILLVYASFKTGGFKPFPLSIRLVGFFVALVRVPVNYMYVRDIIAFLRKCQMLPRGATSADLPVMRLLTGDIGELLLLPTILFSVILLLLYFRLSRRHASYP